MVLLFSVLFPQFLYGNKIMPRKTIQPVKRRYRLDSKDLTNLINARIPGASAKYNYGERIQNAPRIGWYVHFIEKDKPNVFIGINWIDARNTINQLSFFGSVL